MYFLASPGYRRPEAYQQYWNRGAVQGLPERLGSSVPFTPAAKRERSVTDIGDYEVCVLIIYDSV